MQRRKRKGSISSYSLVYHQSLQLLEKLQMDSDPRFWISGQDEKKENTEVAKPTHDIEEFVCFPGPFLPSVSLQQLLIKHLLYAKYRARHEGIPKGLKLPPVLQWVSWQ